MPDPADNPPPPVDPGYDAAPGIPLHVSPWTWLLHPAMMLQEPIALLVFGFWVWMIIHCVRNDPDRGTWLWILIFLNAPGAFIYFVIRWLPGARVGNSSLLGRWTKRRAIPRLEAAARNIGNAHQFVELGEAYRETGKADRAADCFKQALEKEPTNLPALWGAAQVAMRRDDFASARAHLEGVIARDGSYKFGDVSLAHCRCLCALHETPLARENLERHLKRWTHPEACVLLGTILVDAGEGPAAQKLLESMLLDLRGGPAFFARQNRAWERKAKRLLAKIPK